MRYIIILIWLISLKLDFYQVKAQTFELDKYKKSNYTVEFKNKAKDFKFWNEAPPVVLANGDARLYISTTFFSAAWEHHQNLATPIDDQIILPNNRKAKKYYITASSHWWQKFYDPELLASPDYVYRFEWENHHWRRNYNGVFSAHVLPSEKNNQQIVFALSHGENKNEKIGDYFYQNTVRSTFKINKQNPKTYSGGSPYVDCWEAYFGFLNGNWTYLDRVDLLNPAYLNDIGPVAWPSAGYVADDGSQASQGLRHPSSIVYEEYLYIYVVDASMDGTGGVKLIRVKAEDVLKPQQYETWSKSGWVASLPADFSAKNIKNFFSRRGPVNSPIFMNDKNTIKFSVAKFKDASNKFIGVEEFIDSDNTIHVAFRFSEDLINWTERVPIYSAANWSESELRYPVFMNSDGLTDGSVEKNEFYVLGTRDDGNVTKLHFKLDELKALNSVSRNKNRAYQSNYSNRSLSREHSVLSKEGSISNTNLDQIVVSPNPASSSIEVLFTVNSLSWVNISLFDAKGVLLESLIEETFLPQTTKRTLDISFLTAGIYFLTISDKNKNVTKKIVKL